MFTVYRSPGNHVLNRKELAQSVSKTQPDIVFVKMAAIQIRFFRFDGIPSSGWL